MNWQTMTPLMQDETEGNQMNGSSSLVNTFHGIAARMRVMLEEFETGWASLKQDEHFGDADQMTVGW